MSKHFAFILFVGILFSFGFADGQDKEDVFKNRTVPTDPNMMFYIQKNTNPNTIVYALKLGADGKINPDDPMEVFWRRYQEDGRKKKLGWLEKTFAFDFKVKAYAKKPNTYIFSLIALKNKSLLVTQNSNGDPEVATLIDGKTARLERVYLTVDDTKRIQEVHAIELFGRDFKTGELIYEKLVNK